MINDTPDLQSIPAIEDALGVRLPVDPPMLWPDARVLTGQGWYAEPPLAGVLRSADLISGVVVDAADGTLLWLRDLVGRKPALKIRLVLVIAPACPTREEHLRAILKVVEECRSVGAGEVEVRVLAPQVKTDADSRYSTLPPTTFQAHQWNGDTWTCIGSVGDFGLAPVLLGSLNVVFRTEPGLREAWRKWFQFLFDSAAPLTHETCRVPYLVPPEGDAEGARAWADFLARCAAASETEAMPLIDPETGDVVADSAGALSVPWDGGLTAMEPLAARIGKVYAAGCLVSVNELTRIKPLEIPVRAALLGQSSSKTVGSLTQRQSFTLKIFDDGVCKEIDKCRKITDLLDTLTFPLSHGSRWLPNAAKPLLERELEARNERGLMNLVTALGGAPAAFAAKGPQSSDLRERATLLVREFIAKRKEAILADLNKMYKELERGDKVPEQRAKEVLDEVEDRLTVALTTRLTPACTCNPLGPPDLSTAAPVDNWGQPLALLAAAAKKFRDQIVDSYFDRRFSNQAFSKDEFLRDCNVFADPMATSFDHRRAAAELDRIREIMESEATPKERCQALWRLVVGSTEKA